MKIAILGYADQGKAAFEYWNMPDNELTICDIDPQVKVPNGAASQLGPDYLKNLNQFDLLVRTPVLHPRDIVAANPQAPQILEKVTTVTNEFFKVCPSKNIIGVTGTKGKGTTSSLIAKMLEAAGYRVHLGGNIGIAPLAMLKDGIQPEDWVVLELANFQLIDLVYAPYIAVCLMVEPEHLNWHADFEEYITAKQQLFKRQAPDDVAVYFAQNPNSKRIAEISPGRHVPYFEAPGAEVVNEVITIEGQTICSVNELKLLGKHNWQNACAAVTAVWQITQKVDAIKSVLTSFTGLEHRLELVRNVGGVTYYDDSFGTTPETAIVAIEAFQEPKVVILGGSDKGAAYEKLAETVKNNNVRQVVLIGDTAPAIKAALDRVGYTQVVDGGQTMLSIVDRAQAAAHAGDVVLLSTGCASFGLFENYKDRGNQFKEVVQGLS